MIIICLLISVSLLLIGLVIDKQKYSPYFVFNTLWSLIFTMILINPLELFAISDLTLSIFLTGQLLFNVTSMLISSKNKSRIKNTIKTAGENINTGRLIFIQLVLIATLIPLLIDTIPIIVNQGFLELRTYYVQSQNNFMSATERLFYIHLLVFPAITATAMIAALLWSLKKISFSKFSISILSIVLIILVTASRLYLFNFLLIIIFTFMISGSLKKRKIEKRAQRLRIVMLSLIIIVPVLVLVTLDRSVSTSGGITSIFKTIVVYFTGGSHMFDVAINNRTHYGLLDYTYGSTFIAGILNIPFIFLSKFPGFGFWDYFPTDLASKYLVGSTTIGAETEMNAFATIYYFFMRDFGYLGIIVYTIIFASITTHLYNKIRKEKHFFTTLLYVHFLIVIVYSANWWEFYRMEAWTTVIMLYIILFLTKQKKEVKI